MEKELGSLRVKLGLNDGLGAVWITGFPKGRAGELASGDVCGHRERLTHSALQNGTRRYYYSICAREE